MATGWYGERATHERPVTLELWGPPGFLAIGGIVLVGNVVALASGAATHGLEDFLGSLLGIVFGVAACTAGLRLAHRIRLNTDGMLEIHYLTGRRRTVHVASVVAARRNRTSNNGRIRLTFASIDLVGFMRPRPFFEALHVMNPAVDLQGGAKRWASSPATPPTSAPDAASRRTRLRWW